MVPATQIGFGSHYKDKKENFSQSMISPRKKMNLSISNFDQVRGQNDADLQLKPSMSDTIVEKMNTHLAESSKV